MSTFDTVGVLGLGLMGRGIAQVIAQSGLAVTVLEVDRDRLDTGVRAIGEFLAEGVRRGKVTESERAATLERITGTTDPADLKPVDLVIEAVVENPEVKRDLLGKIAAVVRDDAVVATNTSALSVTDLAASVPNPGRVAGLHFFNPAPLMPVVEVIAAVQTEPGVVDRLAAFVGEIGKTSVRAKDRPGFLVNRLLMPYLNDVIAELDAELATAEDIDVALKLGLGYRMGPLELLDLIGLDTHEHATSSAYRATLDSQFAPPPLLRQMVAAGYLGRKSGRGFRFGTHTAQETAR
ncbi:MAG TPA: 3-hydroxyacyl-CoA dehydrogenase family protein [Amycolatopsis sp.]|jgi:3-hydroxybutyryl-CoA dehydrogenase|nr:3-hydroxyacyl-CoA dehydrogenase family protein [Amycolatopsis sp.]